MSRTHSTKRKIAEAKRASISEILVRFEREQEILLRLALAITGDKGTAELSICRARELVMNGESSLPFRKLLTEWLKRVTVETAVTSSLHEIARCESRYMYLNCTHSEHLLNGSDSKLRQFRNLLLYIDPEIVVRELDPLARAVAILRTTGRASILDCILRLRLSLETVLAANCRAMAWFAEKRTALSDKAPTPEQKLENL
jgi:hypothetical protein